MSTKYRGMGYPEDGEASFTVDSKFPLADYEKLVDAADTSDVGAVQEATQAFTRSVQTDEELPLEEATARLGLSEGIPIIHQNSGDD